MNDENPTPEETKNEEPVSEPALPGPAISPTATAFIALIGIFLLYQIGGAVLTVAIFGLDVEKADVNAMRLLTMGGQILLMLLPTLLLTRYVYRENISFILRARFPSLKEIGLFTVGLFLLMPVLQNFLAIQNFVLQRIAESSPFLKNIMNMLDQLDQLVEKTYGSLLASHSFIESSFIILVVAVIPSLCEETLFRGLVQRSFELKFKPYWSILITSLFFGLYHFNPYGLFALIALGAYFGYAAYLSDSIFVPMSLHFLNNLLAVLAFLILGSDELLGSAASKNIQILPQIASLALFGTLFFAYLFYLKNNYNRIVSIKKEVT